MCVQCVPAVSAARYVWKHATKTQNTLFYLVSLYLFATGTLYTEAKP